MTNCSRTLSRVAPMLWWCRRFEPCGLTQQCALRYGGRYPWSRASGLKRHGRRCHRDGARGRWRNRRHVRARDAGCTALALERGSFMATARDLASDAVACDGGRRGVEPAGEALCRMYRDLSRPARTRATFTHAPYRFRLPRTAWRHARSGGINVAVFSAHAAAVELCLFDASGCTEQQRVALPERTGDVFHGSCGRHARAALRTASIRAVRSGSRPSLQSGETAGRSLCASARPALRTASVAVR
jgi:hypothetical protein